jgi:large subunit ribosomal protein L29
VISLKAEEARDLDQTELKTRLSEARAELFNLRFQHATGALENTARIKDVRRDLARLLTVERERTTEE